MHAPRKESAWHERITRSGYFFAALLLHLVLFLLLATLVIWKAPPTHSDGEFQKVKIQQPTPPPPKPPSSGAEANNPQLEPTPVVVPVVTPMSTITTLNSSFHLDAVKIPNQSTIHVSDQSPQGSGLSAGGGETTGNGNGFGSSTGSANQLSGYLLDLKQTSDRKPTGITPEKWNYIMANYIAHNWDDSMLDSYYKSKDPIYTSAIAIATRPSEAAPKAFGLEKEVQPALWAIHYHAKIQAPQAGEYRFVGFGDDVLCVKINGAMVLDGGWISLSGKDDLHEALPFEWSAAYRGLNPKSKERMRGMGPVSGLLKRGPSFHMDIASPVDMDVLIGDHGGICAYFLLIQKQGQTYEQLPDGTPKLPFFQIGNGPAPGFSANEEHPPYSTVPAPWSSK